MNINAFSGYLTPMHAPARFPPLITPHRLREGKDAFAEAVAHAPELGAGNLFYVGGFALIEFALVLEPEEPLSIARKIIFAGMNALADALAVLSPPEKSIQFSYPGGLSFDGAVMGGGRLAIPEGASEDEAPEWLVFGAMLRAGGVRDLGIGLGPGITTLDDEGFDAWNPHDFSASFARHFLIALDQWQDSGMRRIGPEYLARLIPEPGAKRHGLDANGDLLIAREGGTGRVSLVAALADQAWQASFDDAPEV